MTCIGSSYMCVHCPGGVANVQAKCSGHQNLDDFPMKDLILRIYLPDIPSQNMHKRQTVKDDLPLVSFHQHHQEKPFPNCTVCSDNIA